MLPNYNMFRLNISMKLPVIFFREVVFEESLVRLQILTEGLLIVLNDKIKIIVHLQYRKGFLVLVSEKRNGNIILF